MKQDDKLPIAIPLDELKQLAASVAGELNSAAARAPAEALAGPGGGSRHRALPEPLRGRFIDIRAALFQRGIYDPVLVRFDTATVKQASIEEVAEQLAKVADSL